MADDYTITAQRQTMEVGSTGRLQDVWEVTAAVPEAMAQVSVRLPLAEATPENVAAALRPLVDRAKAIAGL